VSKISCFVFTVVFCLTFDVAGIGIASDQELTPDQVIAEHLKSLGRPDVRAATKSTAFLGTTTVNFIQGASGSMSGTSMFVSEGQNLAIALKYTDINYPGEYFAYDGKDVSVGYIQPGQKSPLGDFLFRYNRIIKEGLMGGVLSGSWPLMNIKEKQVELKYRMTTIEDRKLHEIEYHPKQGMGEVKIKLYFEPETFHHVRTDYGVRIRDDMSVGPGGEPAEGSWKVHEDIPDSIYHFVEKFDDFKKVGLTVLPHSYTLYYSVEGRGAFIGEWKMQANEWIFNRNYDPKIFKAQK
jgi:hypothetical protein